MLWKSQIMDLSKFWEDPKIPSIEALKKLLDNHPKLLFCKSWKIDDLYKSLRDSELGVENFHPYFSTYFPLLFPLIIIINIEQMLFTKFTIDTESADKFMDVLIREHREDIKEMLELSQTSPSLKIAKTYHRRYFSVDFRSFEGYDIGISYDKEKECFLFFVEILVNKYVNRIFCEIPEDFVRKYPIPYAVAKEG